MTTTTARIVALLAALATAAFLAGCSSTDTGSTRETSTPETGTDTTQGQVAAHNDADIAFVTDMIPHHQQALELSALVPDRSENTQLIELAEGIAAAQDPEIQAMRALLVQWNADDPDGEHGDHAVPGMPPGMGPHHDMPGMGDPAPMARPESLRGPEVARLWLESLIAPHEGAVEMAQTELAEGENVDARTLAQQIIDAQQAEIDQMRQMLEAS